MTHKTSAKSKTISSRPIDFQTAANSWYDNPSHSLPSVPSFSPFQSFPVILSYFNLKCKDKGSIPNHPIHVNATATTSDLS